MFSCIVLVLPELLICYCKHRKNKNNNKFRQSILICRRYKSMPIDDICNRIEKNAVYPLMKNVGPISKSSLTYYNLNDNFSKLK